MSDKSRGNVRQKAAVYLDGYYNERNRLDISSGAHAAFAIDRDTDVIEVYSDLDFRYAWDRIPSTGIVNVTSVSDNAGVAVFNATAHLFADGDVIVQRGFGDNAYNVMGTVANGTANTYELGISTTELMPNQVDRDFSGASAWANVDLLAYNETGDLTITADAIDQYCTLAVASAPTTPGRKYRMLFDVANLVGSFEIQDFSGSQTLGYVKANGTQIFIDYTAERIGGYRIVALTATASADFDNFKLRYQDDVGQAAVVRDIISSTNGIVLPSAVPFQRFVPKGICSSIDDMIVLHVKATTSVATKYLRITEI